MPASPPPWTAEPCAAPLQPGQLHVWLIDLQVDGEQRSNLRAELSSDELQRAERFVHDETRRRFIAARGGLRRLLGGYLGTPAKALEFRYTGLGKPSLGAAGFHFNLSHSGELALVVVAENDEVGVDIERLRTLRDMEGLAKRFFSEGECEGLLAEPAAQRAGSFFRIWTRKEAILKATGKGLSFPLNKVTVTFQAERPPRLIQLGDDDSAPDRWTLAHLDPATDYIAAVAAPFHVGEIRCRQWTG